jgi:hypothetical protein
MPQFSGAREFKTLLEVAFAGADDRTTMVERDLHPTTAETWRAFRQAGITVSPDMYVIAQDTPAPLGRQLVPDMKADGSELYGKYMAWSLSKLRPRERTNPHADERFIKLLGKKEQQVRTDIACRAALATRNNVQLAYDDAFELIMYPDSSWDLIALDLTHARGTPDDQGFSLETHNTMATDAFEVSLSSIYKSLQERQTLLAGSRRRSFFSFIRR